MRDPIRSALRADKKAWSLGVALIALYLTINGDQGVTQTVELPQTELTTSSR